MRSREHKTVAFEYRYERTPNGYSSFDSVAMVVIVESPTPCTSPDG
jgi:hypothetical protein